MSDHGREWRTRLAFSALALAALAAPAFAQPVPQFLDLAQGVASKIAAALPQGAVVRLAFDVDDARLSAEIARLLAARGLRVSDNSDATPVTAACHVNLRERVCAAAIGRGDDRRALVETAPLDPAAVRQPIAGIALTPLHSQRTVMLDAAAIGEQVLVLAPDTVSVVDRSAGRVVASAPIRTTRVWPRDLRGMLRVDRASFEAFLPGVTCRGAVSPLTAVCADENEPWPIGIDNSGIAPSRNAFATPEGLTFYEAAAIGGGRSLVVGEQGVLTFLDERRRVAARGEVSDHAVALPDTCGGQSDFVVTSGRSPETSAEVLRLARSTGDRLLLLPSTISLAGELTALWRLPAARAATAVVHDADAGRYEAFLVSVSCAR